MANWGIKSSREAIEVIDSSVVDLTSTSGTNILKIFQSGHGTASVARGVVWTLTINHALGYKPFSFFYFKHPELDFWVGAPVKADANIDADAGGPGPATYPMVGNIVNTDTNNVTFELYDDNSMSTTPQSAEYKYFIMIDPRKDSWHG